MKRQRFRVRPKLQKDNDSCNSKSLSSASVGATVIGMASVTTPEGSCLKKTVTFSREVLEHYCFRDENPSTFLEDHGLTNTNRTPVTVFPNAAELRIDQAKAIRKAQDLYREVYGSANEPPTSSEDNPRQADQST